MSAIAELAGKTADQQAEVTGRLASAVEKLEAAERDRAYRAQFHKLTPTVTEDQFVAGMTATDTGVKDVMAPWFGYVAILKDNERRMREAHDKVLKAQAIAERLEFKGKSDTATTGANP